MPPYSKTNIEEAIEDASSAKEAAQKLNIATKTLRVWVEREGLELAYEQLIKRSQQTTAASARAARYRNNPKLRQAASPTIPQTPKTASARPPSKVRRSDSDDKSDAPRCIPPAPGTDSEVATELARIIGTGEETIKVLARTKNAITATQKKQSVGLLISIAHILIREYHRDEEESVGLNTSGDLNVAVETA